jgi:HKD family nuclease
VWKRRTFALQSAIRFGTELLRQVDRGDQVDPFWDKLDIAVAWVRASGMAYLSDRLANFLRHGGQLSVIVGIDIQNTTREGLEALLDLEQHGRSETFVYHNEAGSIFHPKVYLFRNEEEARLIVGSNNITQSGLYVNVEAGLQVDTDINASVVAQTLDALSSWKDTSSRLAV